ncbi:MAG: 30S ribosome-binding factor RbfA [Tissierellia bacterium]|nr:30S ribosome-binding factor RbfA [Tissierellia bacterium]
MNEKRMQRISVEVMRELSDLLSRGLKDPGIHPLTSISRVEVTRDLSFANVFVSVLGNDKDKAETMDALNRAKGFMRSELGKRIKLRITPEIILHLDESIEKSMELGKFIDEVRKSDEQM